MHVRHADGASGGVKFILEMLITDDKDCFLVPVPQYPLYSAALTLFGGTMLPYYLDESSNWSIDVGAVKGSIEKAQKEGKRVRGMVVINPGNPTGGVLDTDNQVRKLASSGGCFLLTTPPPPPLLPLLLSACMRTQLLALRSPVVAAVHRCKSPCCRL